MKQLSLFEGEKHHSERWDLTPRGIQEAAEIIIGLFGQPGRTQALFSEVAQQRLGLMEHVSLLTFEKKAQEFTDLVAQLADMRSDIRDKVEELAPELCLVNISFDGTSSRLSGRRPTSGFALRDSSVGHQDNLAQMRMFHGGMVKAFTRDKTNLPEPARALLANSLGIAEEALQSVKELPPAVGE